MKTNKHLLNKKVFFFFVASVKEKRCLIGRNISISKFTIQGS
jgi:hypothetical protein